MPTETQRILTELARLDAAFARHLGPQGNSSTPNIPHPQLAVVHDGAQVKYVVTDPVERRTFNTTTVTLQQLAEVVSTIIADLQHIKVIG